MDNVNSYLDAKRPLKRILKAKTDTKTDTSVKTMLITPIANRIISRKFVCQTKITLKTHTMLPQNTNPEQQFLLQLKQFIIELVDEQVEIAIENYQPIKKEFWNLKELSIRTSLSVGALRKRILRGTIKAVRSGQTVLIQTEEVERFIKGLCVEV